MNMVSDSRKLDSRTPGVHMKEGTYPFKGTLGVDLFSSGYAVADRAVTMLC